MEPGCRFISEGRVLGRRVDEMKDRAFARSVSWDEIVNGAAETGLDLDEHIDFCIQAMQRNVAAFGHAAIGL